MSKKSKNTNEDTQPDDVNETTLDPAVAATEASFAESQKPVVDEVEDADACPLFAPAAEETVDVDNSAASPITFNTGGPRFAKIHADAVAPKAAKKGDVGFDLTAIEDGKIFPGETQELVTGVRVVLPDGYWGFMRPRSSQGKLGLVSGTGVIDNGYNGPLGYYLTNTSKQVYNYRKGDKIGQLILIPMHPFFGEMEEITVDEIPVTERGSTGFGSTGK